MRIFVHIGPDAALADRYQQVLSSKRDQLAAKGVLYARSPGARNHTRLVMAISGPVDSLRFNRGFTRPEKQQMLFEEVQRGLMAEVARHTPDTLILSAHQLGATLCAASELTRLKTLLAPLSDDIRILAHVDDPARQLVRRYTAQLLDGRARDLTQELGLLPQDQFWQAAVDTLPESAPQHGQFPEAQGAVFWLDTAQLVRTWDAVFGSGATHLHSSDPQTLYTDATPDDLARVFDIRDNFGKAEPQTPPKAPSAAWMARCRLMNDALLRLLAQDEAVLPRPLWRKFLGEIKVHGPAIAPGSLSAVSDRFHPDLMRLAGDHPGIIPAHIAPDAPLPAWREADPTLGFRATQYLMAFQWRIRQATKEALVEKQADLAALSTPAATAPVDDVETALSPTARALMPPLAKQNFAKLARGPFAPHNRLGHINEEEMAAAFTPAPRRTLKEGSTGNVIVGCMKNEAPYILEWVAYHRAMGVDHFLIYTNGCEDGTTELLDRLQALGIVEHRNNDNWKGNSPQQHALNNALREPVIRNADWIIHIDVDEFMNVRCGNGTLDDFFARVPDATNVAMTWRLFGHNGVTALADAFVIDQFDTCAPKFCPKPHTVWGFKTMFQNIGAYEKISCHRPNKLDARFENKVKWVNGSGADMTSEVIKNGWRNSKKTIGYDLLQLNHYALRSAESFLIKRQRGRALHVDRSIGINYWIRMDWSDFRDITIKRGMPRTRAEYDRLMRDPDIARWHQSGLDWHRAKAIELRGMPEFEDLYQQALRLRLTETERVAYALALDMES